MVNDITGNIIVAMTIWAIIKQGTKAVPATRWAVGVVGLVACIALIKQINHSFWKTAIEVLVLLALMTLLVVFARLAQTGKEAFKGVAQFITWSLAILFVGSCICVSTSVFFEWPQLHSPWIGQTRNPAGAVSENAIPKDTALQHAREKAGVEIKVISSPGATVINGDSNKVSR